MSETTAPTISSSPTGRRVRPPAVAGLFYPADAAQLRAEVEAHLASARAESPAGAAPAAAAAPQAMILPHAGYRFSGATAALSYHLVSGDGTLGAAGRFRRAVVIGPAHRVPVRGVALAGVAAHGTPLGEVDEPAGLVAALRERLAGSFPELLVEAPRVHAREHSVEVHLPFLQVLCPELPVLPLVAGDATVEQMGALVAAVLADDDTLLVVSSDLSHYLPEDEAHDVDSATLRDIVELRRPLPPHSACGRIPSNGLLEWADRAGAAATVIGYATSADSPAGDRDRVVGYPAVRFDLLGPLLPALARAALEAQLTSGPPPAELPRLAPLVGHPWAQREAATFVTLSRADGSLRGCIGSLQAHRPLWDDVQDHALAAALRDPRFPAVRAAELETLSIEVSVLSAPEPVPGDTSTEEAAIAALRPGVDGVILAASAERGARRGTFLPSVWEQLPEPAEFLRRLKAKAGLPAAGWSADYRLQRYTTTAWSEQP